MVCKQFQRLFFTLIFSILALSLTAEVRIGLFDGAKPISYIDENGNPAGIYPLVLEEIFTGQGEVFTFITDISFHEAYDMVLSGDLDLMLAFIKTPERQDLFDFTDEVFLVSWSQLFIHPDDSIESILDLKNQRVALMEGGQNGNNFLQLMESFDIPFQAVYYKSFPEMAEAVLKGHVMGMVSFSSFAQSEHRLKASSIIFSPAQSYVAVRKGGPVHLLKMIDDALIDMKNDDNSVYQREMRKLSKTETVEVVPPWLFFILTIVTAGVFIVSLFFILLQRKSAQIKKRLEASEDGYSRLFHSAHDLISVIAYSGDKKWDIIDVNKAFCDKTGYTREEMLSMRIDEYMGHGYESQLQTIQRILEQNDSFLLEAEFPVKNGRAVPVQFSIQIFESRGDKFLLSISRDLTERQELNSAISAVQQKYITIADYNYDWECWLREEGEFIYNSPSCERISGYGPDEFIEKKDLISNIIHPADKRLWQLHHCGSDSNVGQNRNIEFRIIRKDGSVVWINHQCRTIYGPDDQSLGIRGIFRDVTERKEMEEQLSQKQKLSSLGILAGGIAHDFNNILAIIKGFSDVGKNKEDLDEETVGLFDTINQASIRGESLTEQILDFSRNKVAETKPVQISAIIRETYNLIKPTFPSSIAITLNIENNSFIMADDGQVHRTIMNLCTNARLAMPDGGELILSIKELEKVSISTILSDSSSQRWMEVIVKDNGVGMSKVIRQRAFDPYFTTRKTGEGSGMGLAVVHGLVQQWGGTIRIESSPGVGTTIFLYLPILDYPIAVEEVEDYVEIDNKPSKILLIDDEPMILKLLGLYLDAAGYTFSTFNNALEALEEFKKNPDLYKLALMDMTMPGIQGDKLAALLKEIKPELPVILCSGSAQKLQEKHNNDVVDRVLSKPFTQNDVLELISELL